MRVTDSLLTLAEKWRQRADDAFVPTHVAVAVDRCADELEAAIADYWNEPLSVKEAAAWGGYTERHLHKAIRTGEIPLAATRPKRTILRRHVPMKGLPTDLPSSIREVF